MKPTNLLTVFLAATVLSGAALAQPLPAGVTDPNTFDEGSMSYKIVPVYKKSAAGAPAVAKEIPTFDATPQVEQQNNVNFVTGGIGDDERLAIEATKPNYNVHITSSSPKGAFVGDAQVTIHTKAGAEVLTTNTGPLLYVQLPAGSYVLDATLGEQAIHKTFTVGKKGTANIGLSWKVAATTAE